MITCTQCGHQCADDENFCSNCGSKLYRYQTSAPTQEKKKRTLKWTALVAINITIMSAAFFFVSGKGCSKVEGTLTSKGKPAGNFTFVPKQCRSGERMQFFGAAMLGKGQQDGAVVVIHDPIKGKMVKVEVPGSCLPPDYEKCTEILIEEKQCSTFNVNVKRTNIMVNEMVLIDGSLKLDCSFPEGGTIKADMKFENCN